MLRLSIYFFVSIFLIASISSCNKNLRKSDELSEMDGESSMNTGDENTMGDSDSGRAMGLQTVYFPYDSFKVDNDAKATLQANAAILQANPNLRVQVEGHCEFRGGIQYNIALGEKRAKAVRDYLSKNHGITSDRVTTISYGKERLLDPGNDETAHSKNRRGNFVITSN